MPRPATLTPELLSTFITLIDQAGDASAAAEILGINQPSISKRLAYFQHVGVLIARPWLQREGKTWKLTAEGERVLPVVRDLLRRYDATLDFVGDAKPNLLSIACGREAIQGMVLDAVKDHRDIKFRLSTARGDKRIEGVANGLYDMALVTHTPEQIEEKARRKLHIEELFHDRLVLVCAKGTKDGKAFAELPETHVPLRELARFPLILPEQDAGIRKEMERKIRAAKDAPTLNVVLEIGGWSTILAYVREGFGVAFLPRSMAQRADGVIIKTPHSSYVADNRVRLICRRIPGTEEEDLSDLGKKLRDAIVQAARKEE